MVARGIPPTPPERAELAGGPWFEYLEELAAHNGRSALRMATHAKLGEETRPEAALLELADARLTLRRLCEEHGDPDWGERLHLSDVIEKYLARPMLERSPHGREVTEDEYVEPTYAAETFARSGPMGPAWVARIDGCDITGRGRRPEPGELICRDADGFAVAAADELPRRKLLGMSQAR